MGVIMINVMDTGDVLLWLLETYGMGMMINVMDTEDVIVWTCKTYYCGY